MDETYSKTNNKKIKILKFDPEPSGEFAYRILEETNIKGILIGGLAVWAWIEDSSRHGYTKDIDIEIYQRDQSEIVSYLTDKGFTIRDLSIGGFR